MFFALFRRGGTISRPRDRFGSLRAILHSGVYALSGDSVPYVENGIHYCTGSAQAYYQGTAWASNADSKGSIVIYPSSPHSGTCWDVSSKATLTHNSGGDSNSIANMVTYAIAKYNANKSKVFVTGASSGGEQCSIKQMIPQTKQQAAMMTNVMAATYPELFAAASAYSGVAAGCSMSNSGAVDAWNSTCAEGQVVVSPQYWAGVVKAMGGSAPYPKMQIWHGSVDNILLPQNFQEEIKEWTGVFGVSSTATSSQANTPGPDYTTYNYGSSVQGIYATGVGHTVPEHVPLSMQWFGIA